MLLLVLSRLLLIALPFGVYFAWREVARRHGHAMGATPWTWLGAAGLFLVGLSLMATAVLREDNRTKTYVPAQAQPGGRVVPGAFREGRPIPRPAETAPNTVP